MEFSIYQDSRRGGRKTNQDRVGYTYSRDALLMVVCDGMGGHTGGEIASHLCVRLFLERFEQEAQPMLRSPTLFIQDTMQRAHTALLDYAARFKLVDTPRTTCVACVIQANYVYWAHSGDSRLYMFRNSGLIHQTRDHSKVQYLVDSGLITPAQALTHPDRNKVFSCLGGEVEPAIDYSPRLPLQNGDTLLLASDGLWAQFDPAEIGPWLSTGSVLNTTSLLLTEAQRRAGDHCDNLSAIGLRWGSAKVRTEGAPTVTETMRQGEFTTQMDRTMTLVDSETGASTLSDAEMEHAIEEIQRTLNRYGRS
jgi:serine/threonine protein phosphatase PrpC